MYLPLCVAHASRCLTRKVERGRRTVVVVHHLRGCRERELIPPLGHLGHDVRHLVLLINAEECFKDFDALLVYVVVGMLLEFLDLVEALSLGDVGGHLVVRSRGDGLVFADL